MNKALLSSGEMDYCTPQAFFDRLELARLLVKAGYTVSIGKDKEGGTRPRKYIEIGGAENERSVG